MSYELVQQHNIQLSTEQTCLTSDNDYMPSFYSESSRKKGHSLNVIVTMRKYSVTAKCSTAYVARNHLFLSVAWLQRYQQTSQKTERCLW